MCSVSSARQNRMAFNRVIHRAHSEKRAFKIHASKRLAPIRERFVFACDDGQQPQWSITGIEICALSRILRKHLAPRHVFKDM